MRNLRVSVVVPGRNAAATLGSSLHSLRSQDWPKESLEIIYADDASTDESIEIASAFADRILRLTGNRAGLAGTHQHSGPAAERSGKAHSKKLEASTPIATAMR